MTTPKRPSQKKPHDAAKYLTMASYMAVIITLGTLGGRWLDAHVHIASFPLFTLVLSLLSVFAAMWYFIRDFISK